MEWKISALQPVKKPPTFEDNSDWSFQQIERQPLSRASASFGSINPSRLSVTHPEPRARTSLKALAPSAFWQDRLVKRPSRGRHENQDL